MLRVLGVDQSMTNAGFATDAGTTALATRPTPKIVGMDSERERLRRQRSIRDRMVELATDHAVDLVVVEDYAYNQHHQAVSAGELGALLRDALEGRWAWVAVSPGLRAKYATGRANAAKDDVLQSVAARLGHTLPTNDEVDAWLLRQMGLAAYGAPTEVTMPQAHLDALVRVQWPTVALGSGPFAGTLVPPTVPYSPPKKKR